MMEVINSFEMSVLTRGTQCNIQEDGILHSHHHENFKSYTIFSCSQFMAFLERLGRAFNMEELSKEIGVDLHTESLLIRAEQLARLENDKLIDKVKLSFEYFWCLM
jgi:hypothetical protein